MRMARDRGEGNADAILESLTSDQVAELLALEELEPRGPNRDDLRFARLVCWLVSAIPFRGKDATQPKEEQIFATLRTDPLLQVMSGKEIGAAFRRMGARRVKGGKLVEKAAQAKQPAAKPPAPKPTGRKKKRKG